MATRNFARIYGIAFLLVGILGFIPGVNQMHGDAPRLAFDSFNGHLFGLFHVNLLHNLVHVLFGIWGLVASRDYGASRTYARGTGIIYVLFAVMGLVPALSTTFGLIPLEHHDVWLHLLLAVPALYFGFARPATDMPTDEYNTAGTARTGSTTGVLADDDERTAVR